MRPDHLENAAGFSPEPPAPPARQEPPAPNVYSAACPSRRLLALLSDKWSLLILPALKHGPMRNAQLLRAVGGVSQKMLTQTLRHLERCGLILRRDFGEVPPRVEYSLSPLGLSLAGVFAEIDGWVHDHFKEVQAAQDAFDRREEGVTE
jgi:DNA-binding HxlR family transcriptional regulator